MRIAILGSRGIPARYGGFETFAERLSLGLVAKGHEVTVFCEANHGLSIERCEAAYQSVRLRYVSAPRLGLLSTILYDLFSLWHARIGYDVVYMLGYGAAEFCWIPRLWGTEVWINPDGLEWARAKWGILARAYFRLMEWASVRVADRIIADSQAIAETLRERHSPFNCCSVIPYGCDVPSSPPVPDLLREWSLSPAGYYVVICRLEPENHVWEMAEAFLASGSNRKLVIVGDQYAKNAYVRKLCAIRHSHVQMIGTVFDHRKLTALRSYAFGYLHGHSVGGTNPSLLEAMACGNLIFAHDNPFNRETLAGSGLLFRDPRQLSDLIRDAEAGRLDADALRVQAQTRARSYYSWPRIINEYAQLLDR